MTGFVIAAPRVAFSARRALCAPLRFDALFDVLRLRDTFARFEAVFVARDALFVVLRLRDTFARFEAVFVARDALFAVLRLRDAFARFEAVFLARGTVFAAVRPRALPPPTLARGLDAVVFADVLLRAAAVLETVFLEVAVFLASDVFLAGRPRALIPPRDFEAVVFDDLAIHNSLSWIGDLPAPAARQQSHRKPRVRLGKLGTLEALCDEPFAEPSTERATHGAPNQQDCLHDIERLRRLLEPHRRECSTSGAKVKAVSQCSAPSYSLGPRIRFMYHQIPPPITTTAKMIQIHGMSAPVAAGVACASVGEMVRK